MALLLPFACQSGPDESTDGHTSWFRICSNASDCGSDLDCICGVCTRTCDDQSPCPESAGAACAVKGSEAYAALCSNAETSSGICVEAGTSGCAAGKCDKPLSSSRDAAIDDAAVDAGGPDDGSTDGGLTDVAADSDAARIPADADAGDAANCLYQGTVYPSPSYSYDGGVSYYFDCALLDGITLTNPEIVDQGGDGIVSPGESATITVSVSEIDGNTFSYPLIEFSSDNPLVNAQTAEFYSMMGCTTMPAQSHVTFDPSIVGGTTVVFTVSVALQGYDCPGAPSLQVQVVMGY